MDAAYPIGFIGLGTMGQAMALALVKAGTRLLVWKCSSQNEKVSAASGSITTPRFALLAVCLFAIFSCTSEEGLMDSSKVNQFATRYTAAWCSQHAASVASFFAEQGSLKINDGAPAIGRDAITSSAQGFMTAFPDLVVKMDRLAVIGTKTEYHWTLTGTNTGPGGTGKFVRISGFEEWRLGPDGLIADSIGHFDAADYQRQLNADGRSQ